MVKERCSGAKAQLDTPVIGLWARKQDGADNGVKTGRKLTRANSKTTNEPPEPPTKKTATSKSTAATKPLKRQESLQPLEPPKMVRINCNKNKMEKIKRKHVAQFSENLNCSFKTLDF